MLFEALSRRRLFRKGDNKLEKLTSGNLSNVLDVAEGIPKKLAAICSKAMAHDPEARYRAADVMADELEDWLLGSGQHVTARDVGGCVAEKFASTRTKIAAAIEAQLAELPRRRVAAGSWREFGAIVLVRDLARAPALVDLLAPEHLELLLADPAAMAARIRNAGAIFLGPHTPEVIGDYVGGPNHVLPTDRSARFASGLSVFDFLKRTTLLSCTEGSLAELGRAAAALARAEGLAGHARAIEMRLRGADPA
jgi:hypothetical protein